MRAISPNRQTGVVPHLFSRIEELDEQRSPQQSTRGSTSPLQFGQDLVKVFWRMTSIARASPWQGDQTTSTGVPEPHQPSPTERIRSGSTPPVEADPHQRSPTVH